jgi:hypothetical protein
MVTGASESRDACVRSSPEESGAAALVALSALDGAPLDVGELQALSGIPARSSNQEAIVLILGRALGYEVVAMEGGYDDLGDVRVPILVQLRDGEVERYALLHSFDAESARVGDPASGEVTAWPRQRFCEAWSGSVVQATPVEAERRALAARLVELRDPVRRILRAVGWGPPHWKRALLLAGWATVALVGAAAPRGGGSAWTWLVAGACAGSLWSWLGSDQCAACGEASLLGGGLPIAPAGAVLYAALLASRFVPGSSSVAALLLAFAVGAHAGLLRELIKASVRCGGCLFVAACALAAAACLEPRGASLAALAVAAAGGYAAIALVLPRARARQESQWKANAEALVQTVHAEPRPADELRLVAFTREGCSACALFHAAVKPALVATFGDALVIDERPLGSVRTTAPLLVILGATRATLSGLDADDPCGAVIDAVRRAIGGAAG